MHKSVVQRMANGEAVGVEAHGGIGGAQGLARAEFAVFQIDGVADDGVAEMPEVGADLVGAVGKGASFDKRGAVGVAAEEAEESLGGETSGVDVARSGVGWFGGDRGFAGKFLCDRVWRRGGVAAWRRGGVAAWRARAR